MEYQTIELEIEERIALVRFNRPQALNALNHQTLEELSSALEQLRKDNSVGALILTGAGEKAFVAGADIKQMADLTAVTAREMAERGQRIFRVVETFPKPVVAAVNGFCLGGGCELAMACHIRIASEAARFGQPEVKLGLIPGYGGTQRLSRLVGRGVAMELILTGAMIPASRALEIGLVNHVVPAAELIQKARALCSEILANAPLAVRFSIEAINAGLDMSLQEAMALEAALFGLACSSEDMREGTAAFVEKRAARFRGC